MLANIAPSEREAGDIVVSIQFWFIKGKRIISFVIQDEGCPMGICIFHWAIRS
jgi:hypothetical protein